MRGQDKTHNVSFRMTRDLADAVDREALEAQKRLGRYVGRSKIMEDGLRRALGLPPKWGVLRD